MKKLKLLIVANNCKWGTFPQKIQQLEEWFSSKVDFDMDVVFTSFNAVPFKPFQADFKGAEGVDNEWYDKNVTPLSKGHDFILFLMNNAEWGISNTARGWRTDNDQGPIELQISADENERIYYPDGTSSLAFFEYARHEIMHGLYMMTGQKDNTHYYWDRRELDKALAEIVFPEPRNQETIGLIKWAIFLANRLLDKLLSRQTTQTPPKPPTEPINDNGAIKDPIPEAPKASKIEEWAEAIKTMEGWFVGSRSYNNNNPGNLRFVGQLKAIGQDSKGFARFRTYEDGFFTLCEMLRNCASGKSKIYKPTMTLKDFFSVYAPSFDGNQPEIYANFVINKLKVPKETQIKDLL